MDLGKKTIHINCEELSKKLCEALRKKEKFTLPEMNDADKILVDGVQYLVQRPAIRDQLFRFFNNLYQEGKQIVLTFGSC